MAIFKLQAKVTISLNTEIEADSLEEAIEQAEYRDKMDIFQDAYYTKDSFWIAEEIDGEPREIKELEE